ncbi:MAG: hypothetical protein ACFCVK_17920 [Acidimicrobiales bacterium]
MSDKTLGKARGLNSIADPRDFKGSSGRSRPGRPGDDPPSDLDGEFHRPVEHPPLHQPPPPPLAEPARPHRAVVPGVRRKRRELSVPHAIAQALDRTGINPADVVMAGYRRHSDAIYAGEGGRMLARGRTRLRLSISDVEFDQITRLGEARGWNRSETVSVILAMELAASNGAAADRPVSGN